MHVSITQKEMMRFEELEKENEELKRKLEIAKKCLATISNREIEGYAQLYEFMCTAALEELDH